MNKQNFTSNNSFPLSIESLSFMQEMIGAAAGLARIGGENYILSGCKQSGNNVAPGVIVVNGEVMPFEGGNVVLTIVVVETSKDISANGLTFKNARVERYAKFATGTGVNYLPWANFKPLQTNEQLEKAKATMKYVDDAIKNGQKGSIPAGVIVMWSGAENKIPSGWALCNGMTPVGQEIATPNLLGRFIVGFNPTLDSSYRTIGPGGKNPDEYNITLSLENMPKHNHGIGDGTGGVVANGVYGLIMRSTEGDNTLPTGDKSPGEPNLIAPPVGIPNAGESKAFDARPPYYVLAFIIKL